jgi:hypothetical protein
VALSSHVVSRTISKETPRASLPCSTRKMRICHFRKAALVAAFLLATNVISERAKGDPLADSCWPGATWDELGIRHENAARARRNLTLIRPTPPLLTRLNKVRLPPCEEQPPFARGWKPSQPERDTRPAG